MSGRHEPCGANEIWLGNTDKGSAKIDALKAKGLRTVRLGSLAYDIEGAPLPPIYQPLFISRVEQDAYDTIMMKAAFGPYWSR